MLIICTITSSPVPPTPPETIPMQLVPKSLLDAMGGILDEYVQDPFITALVITVAKPYLLGHRVYTSQEAG